MKMKLALFDFDGTLINKDSFMLFSLFCLERRKVIASFMRILPELLIAKVCRKDTGKIKENLFRYLFEGMDAEIFNQRCADFVEILDKHYNKKLKLISEEFQKANIPTIIVSASISNWLEPWAKKNGFTKVIATELEIDAQGKLTGYFKTPNCKGSQKVERIKKELPDIDKYEIYAYGNSKGDKEMLSLATYPYKIGRM